jgi:hypothetical protein
MGMVLLQWQLHDITNKQLSFHVAYFEVPLSLDFTIDFTTPGLVKRENQVVLRRANKRCKGIQTVKCKYVR